MLCSSAHAFANLRSGVGNNLRILVNTQDSRYRQHHKESAGEDLQYAVLECQGEIKTATVIGTHDKAGPETGVLCARHVLMNVTRPGTQLRVDGSA